MHSYFVVNEALEQPGQETEGKTYEGHKWVFLLPLVTSQQGCFCWFGLGG